MPCVKYHTAKKNTPERYYFAILIAPVFINKKETMK
ncbi:hypothetical protein WRSd5_00233 [Shigella dysenteriae WRSd5]|nr:hypothetical protein WRSd5_00233 [Shigella dysenteriae WRSd5]